jgi:hypothetical protein
MATRRIKIEGIGYSVTRVCRALAVPLLLALFSIAAFAQIEESPHPTITGTVIDKDEMPVDGATVCAWPSGPIAGALPCSETNSNGEFAIGLYRQGTYKVIAEHFEKGYPPAIWAFYGGAFPNMVTVIVTDDKAPEPVKIKLGPKAGRLVLTILDGQTDNKIEKGSVTVCRVDQPKSCFTTSTAFPNGRYELLVPDISFTIKFQTTSGGEWVDQKAFDDSGVPFETFQLPLSSRKEMTIRLQ